MIEAVALSTPELGDRTYLLHDRNVAVVIDPQRDIDRVMTAAATARVRIACVAETHIHNDYVSGGWSISQQLGVPYLVADGETVSFDRQAVHPGDEIGIGMSFSLRVVATPGHTPHHVSYVVLEHGRPVSVCTGGSMLFGSTGRTDLFGRDSAVALARCQYQSVQELARLPDWVAVLPTHGFGSFCSVGPSAKIESSTIEQQRSENLVFQTSSEEAFVAALLSGSTAYPSYYCHMAARNRRGMPRPDLSPPSIFDEAQLQAAVGSAAWMVDVRARTAFASAHLYRSINVEHGIQFTTYLGWLLPEDAPLVLMAETNEVAVAAQRDLTRIGIDELAGRYVGRLPPPALRKIVRSYPVRGFAELAEVRHLPGHVTLDVRRQDEWETGHLEGAVNLPLHELTEHVTELPQGTLWIHCAAGFRAGIAASLLERAGRQVVLIDDQLTPANVQDRWVHATRG